MGIVNESLPRWFGLVSILALSALAAPALAESLALLPPAVGVSEQQASDPRSGLGLSGYDPVALLVDGTPQAGLPRYEAIHAGVAWRFATRANRAAFERDPNAFLPRIGGYDTAAAAAGRLASADPTIFVAREGRLYLFRNTAERERFLTDTKAADAAERSWTRLRERLVNS